MATPPVMLFTGGENAVEQPQGFRVCPLGVQFYSPQEMAECTIHECELALPTEDEGTERIRCCGIIAACHRDGDHSMYRIWMKFLDLPDKARDRIECMVQSTEFLCPYCENFSSE